jgi:hypothetical protein
LVPARKIIEASSRADTIRERCRYDTQLSGLPGRARTETWRLGEGIECQDTAATGVLVQCWSDYRRRAGEI